MRHPRMRHHHMRSLPMLGEVNHTIIIPGIMGTKQGSSGPFLAPSIPIQELTVVVSSSVIRSSHQ
jgi:hypothetical protein